jgi:hypothetical protein
MCVSDDLPCDRSDQPALKECMTAVSYHNVIDRIRFGVPHKLLGGMSYGHFEMRLERLLTQFVLCLVPPATPR